MKTTRRVTNIAIALVALTSASSLYAQRQAEPDGAIEFEVASIKPTSRDLQPMDITPSRLTMPSVSLLQLISFAYKVPVGRVIVGENWIRNERFEVQAVASKLADAPAREWIPALDAMLRTLLAQRFSLEIREELRTLPVFVLRIRDRTRTSATGIGPPNPDCERTRLAVLNGEIKRAVGGPQAPLPPPSYCSLTVGEKGDTITLFGGSVSMNELMTHLEMFLGRPIHDETGIQDRFKLELRVGRDAIPMFRKAPADTSRPSGGPSISAALANGLNIDLHSKESPVRVIIVEHARRPLPN